jgi:hypothetical protein
MGPCSSIMTNVERARFTDLKLKPRVLLERLTVAVGDKLFVKTGAGTYFMACQGVFGLPTILVRYL